MWLLLLVLANFLLFIFSVFFLLDIKKIKKINFTFQFFTQRISENIKPLLLILMVVIFHLIEVKLMDPYLTKWVGHDYTDVIKNIENGFVHYFTNYWMPGLLHFFVIIYIFVYIFTLWFAPLYFIIAGKKLGSLIFT